MSQIAPRQYHYGYLPWARDVHCPARPLACGDNEGCLYGQIAPGYTTLWAPLWLDIAPRALWQPRG